MGTPRSRAETGPAPVPGFHVHVESARGRGTLTTALVVPKRPVGALASALEAIHDPRGPADLDERLGNLAAESPPGTAFLVGLEEQVWVYPSEEVGAQRVRDGRTEGLPGPEVVRLEPGDSIELVRPADGSVFARVVREVVAPPQTRPPVERTVRSVRALRVPSRKGAGVVVGIAAVVGITLGIGRLRDAREPPPARSDAYAPPGWEDRVVQLLTRNPDSSRAPASSPAFPGGEGRPASPADPAPEAQARSPAGAWVFRAHGPITSSPLVVGGRVLFGSRDSTLYCLDAASGTVTWSLAAGSGIGSSPCAAEGTCFVGTYGGDVLAVDVRSGEVRWKARTHGKVVSSPCVVGDVVVIGSYDRSVHAFRQDSGGRRWAFATGGVVRASPEPVGSDALVVGSGDGSLYCLAAADGHLLWQRRTASAILAAAAYDPATGRVVVGTHAGKALCLDARTGEILWRAALGSEVNGQPRFSGSVVLLGTGRGTLHALDPASGAARWTARAERGFDARPLVLGETVLAPTFDGVLHFLDLGSGTVRERRSLGAEVFSSPAADDRLVYLGTLAGTFHALALP